MNYHNKGATRNATVSMKLRKLVNIFDTQLFHKKLLKYRKIPVISPGLMQLRKGLWVGL